MVIRMISKVMRMAKTIFRMVYTIIRMGRMVKTVIRMVRKVYGFCWSRWTSGRFVHIVPIARSEDEDQIGGF